MDIAADLDHFGPDFFDLAIDLGGRLLIDGGLERRGAKNSKQ